MKLIGMLDSPYVRRVAISLQLLGLPFEHEVLSVFRHFDRFQAINPVVKVPTLICDDGEVMMDSTLIIAYAQALAPSRQLLPTDLPALQHALAVTGLALAACEKAVQLYYELSLRPAEKIHQPWAERVTGQLLAAFGEIEQELRRQPLAVERSTISLAGISVAVAWYFAQDRVGAHVPAADFPALAAFSARAEALPEFRAAPHGEGHVNAGSH